jgi:uncharacterized membrane protein YgaE (UPF0421/DUF939 family)
LIKPIIKKGDLMKIGMRSIKTAISVFICLILSKLFNVEYPFYAAIAAVISMQSSITNSLKVGKNRMLGTFIGAVVGLLLALIKPESIILTSIGIIIVIYICNLLKWKGSVSIAGIVFISIMVNLGERDPLFYSINRLADTLLGIIVAMAVNYFIVPPKYIDKINKNCDLLIDKVNALVKQSICFGNQIDIKALEEGTFNLHEQINASLDELNKKRELDRVYDILSSCSTIYEHLKMIQSIDGSHDLNEDNSESLRKLYDTDIESVDYERNDRSIVYNYHVSNIINELYNLKSYA